MTNYRVGTPVGYEYQDALSLPPAASLLSEPEIWTDVLVEPPGLARSFVRKAPEFLADPDGVGLFSGFSQNAFFCPPAFLARARDARVVGFRTVLTNDGRFFNDDSLAPGKERQEFLRALSMADPLNEETGLKRNGDGEHFALEVDNRSIQQIAGTTVLLGSAEPSNYGSWLFRVLPKLQTIKRFDVDEEVRFLVWAGFPSFKEYLAMLGVAESRIIQHEPRSAIYELERILVPSIRNNQAFLDKESLELYASLRSTFGSPQERGRNIYVSRLSQSGSSRAMLNEAELIKRLKAMGFQIVNPEELSVREQIRVFSSASMVVGPSGSGMFNVVFCHPGTKVIDIESEPHWIHAHLCLFSSCNLRFGIFVGNAADRDFTTHHKPWQVNITALLDQIQAFSLA